jgi:hypothetical protein
MGDVHGLWRLRRDALAAVAHHSTSMGDILGTGRQQGFHMVAVAPDILDVERHKYFADNVEWKILVPGGRNLLIDLEGGETRLHQRKMMISVVDKMVVTRSSPQPALRPTQNAIAIAHALRCMVPARLEETELDAQERKMGVCLYPAWQALSSSIGVGLFLVARKVNKTGRWRIHGGRCSIQSFQVTWEARGKVR